MTAFGFQWHITNRCNQHCAHCYQTDFSALGEPSLSDLRHLWNSLQQGLENRPIHVNLTGGEPFLHPSFMKLLCCLDASPSLAEMHIITNGTAATDEQLRALQSLGRLASVKVSLESADPHTNDRIRGRGNLDRVCDGIERLRRNTGKDVVLMMTLSKDNLHDIDGMVRFCRTRDVRGLILERFVPLGRGAGQKDRMLSPADWQSVVSDVLRLSDSDQLPSEMTDWRAFRLSFENGEVALEGALCNLGDESMALMPDGTVYPCRRLPVPVGNAAREPFDAILRRLASRCAQTHAGPDDPCLGCRALSAAIGRGYP